MSNEIVGRVSFFNGDKKKAIFEGVDDVGRSWKVINFSLYSKKCGGYLPFKSYDYNVIEALQEGQEYKILEYFPKARFNVDKITGTKTKIIEFFALKVEPYTSNKNKKDMDAYKLLDKPEESINIDKAFEEPKREEDDGFNSANEIDWDSEFN